MSNVILFNDDPTNLVVPAAAAARRSRVNDDIHMAAQFATMSIKGKVFTYIKDGMQKRLEKKDEMGETVSVQYIQAVVLRANVKSRVYYEEEYSEDDSKGAKPTCFSHDGVAPDNASRAKQAAKCALCPHAVWGTGNAKTGEGTACAPNARLAIASPDKLKEPMLLRVPPASIKSFKEAVKIGDARQAPYNSLVMRISFDQAAASPKLVFKPVGVLNDEGFAQSDGMYDNDVVTTIVGTPTQGAPALPAPTPAAEPLADELDAALAAKAATTKAARPPAEAEIADALEAAAARKRDDEAVARAKAAKAAKEEAARVAAELEAAEQAAAQRKAATSLAPAEASGGLLSELDGLLGSMDD